MICKIISEVLGKADLLCDWKNLSFFNVLLSIPLLKTLKTLEIFVTGTNNLLRVVLRWLKSSYVVIPWLL